MRRSLVVVALVLVLAAVAAWSAADSARSGIRGRVIDTTCLGPCTPGGGDRRPYSGRATVVVHRLSSGDRVAGVPVRRSRFRTALPPGRYRLEVRIDDPCWSSAAKRLRVGRHRFERVRLEVSNDCIRGELPIE